MVNAARTLLLNVGQTDLSEYAGDQYVDPAFKPVNESAPVRALKAALFGTSPDRFTLNYRAAQYMALVHSDPVARRLALDMGQRVTYDGDASLFDVQPSCAVRVIVADTLSPVVVGAPVGDQRRGRNRRAFDLLLETDEIAAFITWTSIGQGAQRRHFALDSPYIKPFKTPDEPSVSVHFNDLALTGAGDDGPGSHEWVEFTPGDLTTWAGISYAQERVWHFTPRYLLTMTSRPAADLSEVIRGLSSGAVAAAIETLPAGEPRATLAAMASQASPPLRRLCGAVLAVAHANQLAHSARGA